MSHDDFLVGRFVSNKTQRQRLRHNVLRMHHLCTEIQLKFYQLETGRWGISVRFKLNSYFLLFQNLFALYEIQSKIFTFLKHKNIYLELSLCNFILGIWHIVSNFWVNCKFSDQIISNWLVCQIIVNLMRRCHLGIIISYFDSSIFSFWVCWC